MEIRGKLNVWTEDDGEDICVQHIAEYIYFWREILMRITEHKSDLL